MTSLLIGFLKKAEPVKVKLVVRDPKSERPGATELKHGLTITGRTLGSEIHMELFGYFQEIMRVVYRTIKMHLRDKRRRLRKIREIETMMLEIRICELGEVWVRYVAQGGNLGFILEYEITNKISLESTKKIYNILLITPQP